MSGSAGQRVPLTHGEIRPQKIRYIEDETASVSLPQSSRSTEWYRMQQSQSSHPNTNQRPQSSSMDDGDNKMHNPKDGIPPLEPDSQEDNQHKNTEMEDADTSVDEMQHETSITSSDTDCGDPCDSNTEDGEGEEEEKKDNQADSEADDGGAGDDDDDGVGGFDDEDDEDDDGAIEVSDEEGIEMDYDQASDEDQSSDSEDGSGDEEEGKDDSWSYDCDICGRKIPPGGDRYFCPVCEADPKAANSWDVCTVCYNKDKKNHWCKHHSSVRPLQLHQGISSDTTNDDTTDGKQEDIQMESPDNPEQAAARAELKKQFAEVEFNDDDLQIIGLTILKPFIKREPGGAERKDESENTTSIKSESDMQIKEEPTESELERIRRTTVLTDRQCLEAYTQLKSTLQISNEHIQELVKMSEDVLSDYNKYLKKNKRKKLSDSEFRLMKEQTSKKTEQYRSGGTLYGVQNVDDFFKQWLAVILDHYYYEVGAWQELYDEAGVVHLELPQESPDEPTMPVGLTLRVALNLVAIKYQITLSANATIGLTESEQKVDPWRITSEQPYTELFTTLKPLPPVMQELPLESQTGEGIKKAIDEFVDWVIRYPVDLQWWVDELRWVIPEQLKIDVDRDTIQKELTSDRLKPIDYRLASQEKEVEQAARQRAYKRFEYEAFALSHHREAYRRSMQEQLYLPPAESKPEFGIGIFPHLKQLRYRLNTPTAIDYWRKIKEIKRKSIEEVNGFIERSRKLPTKADVQNFKKKSKLSEEYHRINQFPDPEYWINEGVSLLYLLKEFVDYTFEALHNSTTHKFLESLQLEIDKEDGVAFLDLTTHVREIVEVRKKIWKLEQLKKDTRLSLDRGFAIEFYNTAFEQMRKHYLRLLNKIEAHLKEIYDGKVEPITTEQWLEFQEQTEKKFEEFEKKCDDDLKEIEPPLTPEQKRKAGDKKEEQQNNARRERTIIPGSKAYKQRIKDREKIRKSTIRVISLITGEESIERLDGGITDSGSSAVPSKPGIRKIPRYALFPFVTKKPKPGTKPPSSSSSIPTNPPVSSTPKSTVSKKKSKTTGVDETQGSKFDQSVIIDAKLIMNPKQQRIYQEFRKNNDFRKQPGRIFTEFTKTKLMQKLNKHAPPRVMRVLIGTKTKPISYTISKYPSDADSEEEKDEEETDEEKKPEKRKKSSKRTKDSSNELSDMLSKSTKLAHYPSASAVSTCSQSGVKCFLSTFRIEIKTHEIETPAGHQPNMGIINQSKREQKEVQSIVMIVNERDAKTIQKFLEEQKKQGDAKKTMEIIRQIPAFMRALRSRNIEEHHIDRIEVIKQEESAPLWSLLSCLMAALSITQ